MRAFAFHRDVVHPMRERHPMRSTAGRSRRESRGMVSRWFIFSSHHAALVGHIQQLRGDMNKRIRRKRVRRLLLVELAVLFKEPADAIRWLETPLEQFEGRTPRETIASGEIERVTLLLDALRAAQERKAS